jgi:hypothetical protein
MGMRGSLAGASVLWVMALLPAAASARPRQLEYSATAVGSALVTWSGDPARGCAAAGLCGVSGSLTLRVGNASEGGSGPVQIDINDDNAVARVSELAADGSAAGACADPVQVDVPMELARRGGRLVAVPISQLSFGLPASGRCAGPVGRDFEGLSLPARRIRGGYDLSGADTFGAGPFTVTVDSHLRALVSTGVAPQPPFAPPPPVRRLRTHRGYLEIASVTYRISSVTGAPEVTFAGIADPFCEGVGTCGDSGTLALTLQPAAARLTFTGTRLVAHPVGAARALADLRRGRLSVYDDSYALSLAGRLAESFQPGAAGAPACRDTVPVALGLGSVVAHGLDRFTLDPVTPAFPSGVDPLRSHCPGPLSGDAVTAGGLAGGSVALAALGDPGLSLPLAAGGSFAGGGYTGSRSGTTTLSLERVAASGGTHRVRVAGGQVVG